MTTKLLAVLVLVVLAAACSTTHKRLTPGNTSSTSNTAGVATAPRCPSGGACPAPVTADELCVSAFGRAVIESAATTAGSVRHSGVGLRGGAFEEGFPEAKDADFAAWCMVSDSRRCYDESAVAINGTRQHIASAWCGGRPPAAGPAIWTN